MKKFIIPSMKNFRLVQKCVMSQISNFVLTVLEVLDDAATFEASKAKLTRTLENFLKKNFLEIFNKGAFIFLVWQNKWPWL